MVRFHLYTWWNLAYLNRTLCMARHALVWFEDAYLSLCLQETIWRLNLKVTNLKVKRCHF
jgi:hypothetical protein